MNNLVDLKELLDEMIDNQILKNEKAEKERDKKWRIEKMKKCLNCRQVKDKDRFYSIPSLEAHYIRDFCLWYSKNIERFVIEDNVFQKGIGHFSELNILMIYDGFGVIENFRYIKFHARKNTRRRNYFVIWFEGDVLKWKAISGQLYEKMRKDFEEGKNAIERFWEWEKKGEKVLVWDFFNDEKKD